MNRRRFVDNQITSPADLTAIKSSLAAHQARVAVATDTVLRGLRATLIAA